MAAIEQNTIKSLAVTNVTYSLDSFPMCPPTAIGGKLIADACMMIMALICVFVGSKRAVRLHQLSVQNDEMFVELPDLSLTEKEAMAIPFISSAGILAMYFAYKVLSKECIRIMLTAFLYVIGASAGSVLFGSQLSALLPRSIPKKNYLFLFTEGSGRQEDDWLFIEFTLHHIICYILCAILTTFYLYTKNWIANNIFALALAIYGVEFMQVNNIKVGCILLCGLFVYDVFWVFYSDVMATLAFHNSRFFDSPTLILFPQDFFENGIFDSKHFSMLGLGDIFIPGIFIALLLRFDQSLKRKTNLYFNTTFFAYFLGLLTTIFAGYIFKVGQPALLYMVPVCVITPILVALISGDLKALFSYEEQPIEIEWNYESSSESSKSE